MHTSLHRHAFPVVEGTSDSEEFQKGEGDVPGIIHQFSSLIFNFLAILLLLSHCTLIFTYHGVIMPSSFGHPRKSTRIVGKLFDLHDFSRNCVIIIFIGLFPSHRTKMVHCAGKCVRNHEIAHSIWCSLAHGL